jgi:hypothetical protein
VSSCKPMNTETFSVSLDRSAKAPHELVIRACTIYAGRHRWDIRQSSTPVQSSMESFARPQEAHTDGRQVIKKLAQISRLGQ